MPRIITSCIAALSGVLLAASLAHAGAWTQPKHSLFLKLSANYIRTAREFDYTGTRMDIFQERAGFEDAWFRDFSVYGYAEYGLTDRFTLVVSLPLRALTSSQALSGTYLGSNRVISNTVGLGDFTAALRVSLLRQPLVVSWQAGAKIPLGYDESPDNDGPPLGTGEVDIENHLLVGLGLHPLPAYVTGGIGYRSRGGPLHDEVVYSFEAGVRRGRTLFKVSLDGVKNTSTPPDLVGMTVVTPLPGGGGVVPSVVVGDQDYTKISPSVILGLREGLAVQAEAIHMLVGKNTISGTTFSVGIILER